MLCHGRCLLLTPGSGPSPGTSWLVGTGLAGFSGRSPSRPVPPHAGHGSGWRPPPGACAHPQHGAPDSQPTVSCVRALTSGSSCWHVPEEWVRGAGVVPWVPPATPWLPPRQCFAVIPLPEQACPRGPPNPEPTCQAGMSGQSLAVAWPKVQARQATVPWGPPSTPWPQSGHPGPWGSHGPGTCWGAGWGQCGLTVGVPWGSPHPPCLGQPLSQLLWDSPSSPCGSGCAAAVYVGGF